MNMTVAKALIFAAALLSVTTRVAYAESVKYMVISPDHVALAMKLAMPVFQSGRPSFVIDSKGCLLSIGEDRDTGAVGTVRVAGEHGKPVCAVAK